MSEDSSASVAITANTQYFISTSGRPKSLRRYNYLLQQILKKDVAYIPISSPSGKIDAQHFANVLKGMNCIGGAISKDIKHSIIACLDDIDPLAQQIQSVNTVVRRSDGTIKGYNTDATGFRQAISSGVSECGVDVKKAVVYGYGGVSSVVFHVLQSLGIEVYVTGRNRKAAEERAHEFNVKLFNGETCDLFVNATPVTDRDLSLADNFIDALKDCKLAFDHELEGRYLTDYCATNGIAHISGLKMYYPQMQMQWELFLEGLVDKAQIPALLQEAEEKC